MLDVFRKTLFKHSSSEARDCQIEWLVDFGTMMIKLKADFISPALILDCLQHISRVDERFDLAGIKTPINIGSRFNIQLQVGKEMHFKVNVYQLRTGSDRLDRSEIELIPLHEGTSQYTA